MGFLKTADGNFIKTADGNYIVTSDAILIALACASNVAVVGTAYSSSVTATTGTPPYAYSVINGSLPNGLSLNGATGLISGTPTLQGTFSFDILVTDTGLGTQISSCIIYVTSAAVAGSGIYKIIPN